KDYMKFSWYGLGLNMFNLKVSSLGTKLNKLQNLNSRSNLYEIALDYKLEGLGEKFSQFLSFWTKMGLHG
ncbi:hypothetical protein, partial [Salmonella sp. sc-h43]|uniref:hypothetical protein n=1 Tax=Salmonella sp. sc-h43 TaxID=2582614 RepID=UPI001F423C3B